MVCRSPPAPPGPTIENPVSAGDQAFDELIAKLESIGSERKYPWRSLGGRRQRPALQSAGCGGWLHGWRAAALHVACLYRDKRLPRPCQNFAVFALGDTCKVLRG